MEGPSLAEQRSGVIYRHTVEALVGIVRKKRALSDAELTALGVYPCRDVSIEVWSPAVHAMAKALFPHIPPSRALEESGREIVRNFTQGVVGNGVLMVIRLMGRRRALQRIADSFRSADSVMEVSSTEKSPTWLRVRFERIYGLGEHMTGVLREAMELADGKTPVSVTGLSDAQGGYDIDVKW